MTIAALVLAAVSLLWAMFNHRRASILTEDLRHVHRTSRQRLEQGEESLRRLEGRLAEIVAALPREPDGPGSWFTPYMTIQDAINLHPGVKDVLASMHIGGCSSCSVSTKETLEQAATGHGVDLKTMLARMNALMRDEQPADPALAAAEKALPPANGGRVMLATMRSTGD